MLTNSVAPDFTPQRVVSLQPSITMTLDGLGMLDRVVACTRHCAALSPSLNSSERVIVADSWSARSQEILAANPDFVMASVPYQLDAVAEILKAGIPFLAFAPRSLSDIYCDIFRIAAIMGVPDCGGRLVEEMRQSIAQVREKTAHLSPAQRPAVYCEEWGKPLIHSQLWVAELVEAAGGAFVGAPGTRTDAESIASLDPEIMIAAWCGAGERVPLNKLVRERKWQDTKAVRHRRLHCIRDDFLNTPAPSLIRGLRALAAAIHPSIFGETAEGLSTPSEAGAGLRFVERAR